ncbi:hypothetical protein OESDEN_16978 [Oesophagostomum dentatum]|uniref:SSD domain-containing protein n=1 Tax=Oesophagostomum dentatum TaxID=61180 RepID=A0A0B1SJC7_OESDE|nr:hypothetical protein OESDEN_16978 [Oesophagostomum dentatum]
MLAGASLQPFLLVGFLIMCVFCTITTLLSSVIMYNHKATYRKVILSITACVVPFMACGTAFGLIFLLGVTFSPILNVTPFLVLAISVDDSFLMVHSWNRIESDELLSSKPRPEKMVQVLIETGPAITISAFTNILAFGIGAYSSPPEIRLFCIGNAACIFHGHDLPTVFPFPVTFYTAIMALLADSPLPYNEKQEPSRIKVTVGEFLRWYTCFISDWRKSLAVMMVWTVYVGGAIVVCRSDTWEYNATFLFRKCLRLDSSRKLAFWRKS